MSVAKYATRNPKASVPTNLDPDLGVVGDVLLGVLGMVGPLLRLLLARPIRFAVGLATGYLFLRTGVRGLAAAATSVLVLAVVWRVLHRSSFEQWVWRPLLAALRRWWVYGRQWQPVLVAHGLVVTRGLAVPMVPRLLPGAVCDPWADRLRVDLVPGLGPQDFEREAGNLAHAFGSRRCSVTVLAPGRVLLTFARADPLVRPVPALPVPRRVDLRAVPVGVTEDGMPWTLPAIGTHLLIAGATGSGKGSVLWSLLRGLAPEIAAGRVQVWGIDPKGGMELAFGQALFTRLADGPAEGMVNVLEDATTVLADRTQRLKGRTRMHTPTVDEPLLLIVIDELASLTAYLRDRDLKRRVDVALQQLLTKGRAPGVTVVGALQDPRKEVLGYRDLFPARVALRLTEKEQVGMVLGDSAWHYGAHCERIPTDLPGVGYVLLDGRREPVRVRAGYVTDDDLRELAERYPAPPPRIAAVHRDAQPELLAS